MTSQEYDVVVVGSGGAGMVAALAAAHQGLSTIVIEKAPHYGGSTARSGGGVWIPNNKVLKRRRIKDTPEAARTYLHGIVGDVVPAEKIDTYLERGPEMLSFVLANSPLKMCWVPGYSDYYPEAPGGRPGGRSIEPKPFNAKKLGADMAGLEPAYGKVPLNMVVMQQDYVRLNQLKRHPRGVLRSLKVGARSMWARATGKNLVGMGRALIGPLRIGLQRAGVPVRLNTALTDLYVEDGVVRGVYVLDTSGAESSAAAEPELIRATRGVILASGGFEHNEQMRVKYQRAPITTEWTVGAKANTGDGILAGEKLGAALDVMADAWWGPTVPLVGAPWFALSERSSPGSIIVNASGQRFMNESMPYVESVHHMYGGQYGQGPGPGENIPAWLIFDQRYRDNYIFAGLNPGQRLPRKWLESGVIVTADTLAELAEKTGLPAEQLAATVQRFNGFARDGVDADYHRGDSHYDRYYGDPTNKPNPNLAELSRAPYYAAKMVPGDLGTKGGIRTDVHGRAL
ncbi:MAG TPA: 3-oxosteroid 1-dehydrogenase, partial [Mycobacterium sp.]|nr:3-oxosteroid 1-dehydrogenase [Mycobacterium sp.]